MAFGMVSAVIHVEPSLDQDPAPNEYTAVLDWEPIPDGPGPYPFTHIVPISWVPGDTTVSRQDAPFAHGEMYIRVFASAAGVAGPLSEEVVHSYDFRPAAPTLTLA